jgi:hypothetical protein
MTREEHLKFCAVCTKRSFNPKIGIVCSLTQEVANFENSCPDYAEDPHEVKMEEMKVQRVKNEKSTALNRGRSALFVIVGLYVLAGIYEAFLAPWHQMIFGIIDWIVAAIFLGLAIWSYRQPFPAMVTGLCLYVLIILLLAAIDPATLFQGIIWKILVTMYLVYGIQNARKEQNAKKQASGDILDQI